MSASVPDRAASPGDASATGAAGGSAEAAAPPARPLPSIAGRLARQLLLISLGWALLAGGLVWLVVQEEVDELLDETLQASSQVLGQLLRHGAGTLPGQIADEDDLSTHFAWQLVGADGALRHRSPLAPGTPWQLQPGFNDWNSPRADGDEDEWRIHVRALQTPQGAAWLMVAQTGDEREEVRTRVGLASAATALLVGVLSVAFLWQRARRELAPLKRMTEALAAYDPLDPAQALPEQDHRELAEIRVAVHALGRRLAQRVANERAFSAHAAHALRTPLAGMDAQLAMALREAPPDQHERLQRTREAADRLRRVVTALLTLFRSGMRLQWQRIDLDRLLATLPLPSALALDLPQAPWVEADPDLLAAALINLMDNAWRHRATRLTLRLRPLDGGGVLISLRDNGEGVPEPQRLALDAALAAEQYEGRMGLGLMMADLVARAHGGAVRLPAVTDGLSAAATLAGPGPGFAVEMRLGPSPA